MTTPSEESNAEPPPPRWPMTCSCGEEWPRETWSELPPIGRYFAGREGWMELRSCVCGAALVVPADAIDADAT